MLGLLTKKFNLRFFWLNLISVFVFTVLYYVQDLLMVKYKDQALRYGLLKKDYHTKFYSNESSSLYYYLWYSLITQTTVGYSGSVDSKTGESVPFLESPNRVFKFLNVMQLCSVLFIISLV